MTEKKTVSGIHLVKFGEDGLREYPGYKAIGYKITISDDNGIRVAWTKELPSGVVPIETYFEEVEK